jgi:tetratricopeptide (TPR) repeat protein
MKIINTITFLLISVFCYSQTLNDKVQEINKIKDKGDYELALLKTENLISAGNELAELYLLKAQCLMEGKKQLVHNESFYETTLIALNKSIELDSNYKLPYGRRGLLNLMNRRFTESITDYTKFISLTSDSTDLFNAYTDRGTAKMYSGDANGAIQDYESAITLNPYDISIYQNLGAIYTDSGEPEKAKSILSDGLEIYPNEPSLLNNLGYLNITLENYNEAKSYFDKAIKIDDNDYLAYGNRGFCLIQLDKLKQARNDLDKSILLKPDNSYVYMYNAKYYIKTNDVKRACENLSKATSLGFKEIYGQEVDNLTKANCK